MGVMICYVDTFRAALSLSSSRLDSPVTLMTCLNFARWRQHRLMSSDPSGRFLHSARSISRASKVSTSAPLFRTPTRPEAEPGDRHYGSTTGNTASAVSNTRMISGPFEPLPDQLLLLHCCRAHAAAAAQPSDSPDFLTSPEPLIAAEPSESEVMAEAMCSGRRPKGNISPREKSRSVISRKVGIKRVPSTKCTSMATSRVLHPGYMAVSRLVLLSVALP